jgi:hypothetical protein
MTDSIKQETAKKLLETVLEVLPRDFDYSISVNKEAKEITIKWN